MVYQNGSDIESTTTAAGDPQELARFGGASAQATAPLTFAQDHAMRTAAGQAYIAGRLGGTLTGADLPGLFIDSDFRASERDYARATDSGADPSAPSFVRSPAREAKEQLSREAARERFLSDVNYQQSITGQPMPGSFVSLGGWSDASSQRLSAADIVPMINPMAHDAPDYTMQFIDNAFAAPVRGALEGGAIVWDSAAAAYTVARNEMGLGYDETMPRSGVLRDLASGMDVSEVRARDANPIGGFMFGIYDAHTAWEKGDMGTFASTSGSITGGAVAMGFGVSDLSSAGAAFVRDVGVPDWTIKPLPYQPGVMYSNPIPFTLEPFQEVENGLIGSNGTANAATVPLLREQLLMQQAFDPRIGTTLEGAALPIQVTAEGNVGGGEFFDTNQTARPLAFANPDQPTLISDLVPPLKPNANMANAHAEVGVMQQAFDARVTQGADMSIVIRGQEPLCSYCSSDVWDMAARANLNSLKVVDTTGQATYFWDAATGKVVRVDGAHH